jgi:hypothetical protein
MTILLFCCTYARVGQSPGGRLGDQAAVGNVGHEITHLEITLRAAMGRIVTIFAFLICVAAAEVRSRLVCVRTAIESMWDPSVRVSGWRYHCDRQTELFDASLVWATGTLLRSYGL